VENYTFLIELKAFSSTVLSNNKLSFEKGSSLVIEKNSRCTDIYNYCRDSARGQVAKCHISVRQEEGG
jgi:hypothetical protein